VVDRAPSHRTASVNIIGQKDAVSKNAMKLIIAAIVWRFQDEGEGMEVQRESYTKAAS
jgi:hypothetical protein